MTPETKPIFTQASSDAKVFCDYLRSHQYIPEWAKEALTHGDEAAYEFAVKMLNCSDRVTVSQAFSLFLGAGFRIEPVRSNETTKLSRWGLGK